MADRYTTPVMFGFEKNIVFVYLRAVFGASGTVVLDQNNSKGVCAFNPNTVVFNGNTVASSATISSVTSFAGLYPGMSITGSPGTLGANITISSMTAGTGSLVLSSGTNVVTQPADTLFASGGQYLIQFGQLAGVRLDSYNKLLSVNYDWREVTGSAAGSSTTVPLFPAATDTFVTSVRTGIRTIPQTLTSGSSDCSITIQMGFYGSNDNTFTAVNPQPGEVLHMSIAFCNSTAI